MYAQKMTAELNECQHTRVYIKKILIIDIYSMDINQSEQILAINNY